MPKQSIIFSCSKCGAQFSKWTGRCLECGQWGTIEKSQNVNSKTQKLEGDIKNYQPTKTSNLNDIKSDTVKRITTKISELNRVLGGGLVPGSVILLGGEPGIGKSTLALQLATSLPNCLYLSGEESVGQIKMRADRLKITTNDLNVANETNIETIVSTIASTKPALAIVDSIQTVFSAEAENDAGGPTQIRACATKLLAVSKNLGVPIIIIGQVTKDGTVAGPKTLEHLVDTVLYLEGDKFHNFRILRAIKNRFGSTDEVGIFSMEEFGLKEVLNPSQAFLSGRPENVPGSAIACLMEGTRPILIEIQALVTKTNFGYPQRRSFGFDLNRLQVLLGVLTRRAGLPLDSYDVFVNVIGGMEAQEPAADLAVALAVASGFKNKTLPANLVSFGEIGLSGELRPVGQTKRRLEEIKNLGFKFAAIPATGEQNKITGIKIAPVKNIQEVIEQIIK